MNDVHKIAARKLRSLAAVIRAEAYAPHEFGVREAMEAEAVELERRAEILAPLPKAPEPTDEFSVIEARTSYGKQREYLTLLKTFWVDRDGNGVGAYADLRDVEVLRVGLGPQPLAEWESDFLNLQARRDIAANVLEAMDVDQYLIDAVRNAKPEATS